MTSWMSSYTPGRTGHADISIPLSGPDGKGTIYVVAEKSDGQWSFSTLKVAIQPTGEIIDLMASERRAKGTASADP